MCAYSNNLFAKPGEAWSAVDENDFFFFIARSLLFPLNIEFCANITLFFFSVSFPFHFWEWERGGGEIIVVEVEEERKEKRRTEEKVIGPAQTF